MKCITNRNKWRLIGQTAILPILLLFLPSAGFGQVGQQTDLVMATVRLSNPKSTATGFILFRPGAKPDATSQFLLVTAAHVLEKAEGDEISINYRRKMAEGEFAKSPVPLKVRREGKALWTQHPRQDVAVIAIEPPAGIELPHLGTDFLATAEDLKDAEPGDLVRYVGFPHASIFEPNQAAFPMVRVGCIASYPLLPIEKHPLFLVDYNAFEGDSGGSVWWKKSDPASGKGALKILGLVHGQHFFNQRFDFVYESGEFRKQLGLGIVVHAEAIIETIAKVP